MKVFDLSCSHAHRFEAWFRSAEDYETQLAQQLIECPFCGSTTISRLPSAPRLNLSNCSQPSVNKAPTHDSTPQTEGTAEATQHAQLAHPASSHTSDKLDTTALDFEKIAAQVIGNLIKNTENVGKNFAEEARKIHYGESPERAIRGQATPTEVVELRDEGIEFAVWPSLLPNTPTLQ